jgi:hypothetical protein
MMNDKSGRLSGLAHMMRRFAHFGGFGKLRKGARAAPSSPCAGSRVRAEDYEVNFTDMVQKNLGTGKERVPQGRRQSALQSAGSCQLSKGMASPQAVLRIRRV